MDFYVLIAETGGPVGPIPFERVIRFTCSDLEAAGLAMRFGAGGVVVESGLRPLSVSDALPSIRLLPVCGVRFLVQCSLEKFVARGAAQGADLIALPISKAFDRWHWMPYQRDVYPFGEARLALLNVSSFLSSVETVASP